MIRRLFESKDTAVNALTNGLTAIADEWKIVAKNFTLVDPDEIATAVNLINNDIESLKQEDCDELVDALSVNSDLDIFDDIYVEKEGNKKHIIADCFLLNSTLTKEERIALFHKKDNVELSGIRENGRDVLRVKITL